MCVTIIIQLMIRYPWITLEEILNYLTWIGPAYNVRRLMRMFGGRAVFMKTMTRLDVIRQARIKGTLDLLPIDAEPFDGTIPAVEGNIGQWAPNMIGAGPPFQHPSPGGQLPWEPLHRYPHEGTYSGDLWEEQSWDSEGSLEGGEWSGGSEEGFDSDFNLARSEAST